jgi:hypothetical protein
MNINSPVLQKNLKELDSITDGLGLPIDQKIKFPVAVLRSLNFITTSSCSGHITGETPYIQVSSQNALDFENSDQVKELVSLLYKYPFEENYQKKYRLLCVAPKEANRSEGNRLFQLMKKFYELRNTDDEIRLILESIGDGLGGYRIFPQGSLFIQLKKKEDRAGWLNRAQGEFQDFAEFLCNKI